MAFIDLTPPKVSNMVIPLLDKYSALMSKLRELDTASESGGYILCWWWTYDEPDLQICYYQDTLSFGEMIVIRSNQVDEFYKEISDPLI